ncbi:MAG: MFS transporter [Firmicutes bacterium]|nr:MFS transporter [Bacillota bacterium]
MNINKKIQYRLLSRNIRYAYIEGMAFCFMLGTTIPYLGLYILRFNGPEELVSLIASAQPVILCIFSLLAASFVNSFQKKKPVLIPASFLVRIFVFLIALIPLFPKPWHAWMLFIMWSLMYIPWAFSNLSWSPMMSNIIPDEMQARFFGTRNTLTGVTTLLGTIFTGFILGKMPFLPGFSLIFIISFAGTIVSLYYLNKQIEPLVPDPGETKKQYRTHNCPLFQFDFKTTFSTFWDPIYGKIFGLTCLAIFIFHIGYSMAIPLFTLRQVQQLGLDNSTIGWIATLTGLAALFGSYIGGRASNRWGYRYVLLFSTMFSIIPPLIWALTPKLPWLYLASFLWGLTGNAYMICFLYMVLAVSPFKDRSRFVAMNTVTGNLAGALGPIIGMFLIKIPAVEIQGSLLIASLFMFIGAIFSFLVAKKGNI